MLRVYIIRGLFIIVLYFFIYSPYLRLINMGSGKILIFFALLFFCINYKALKYLAVFKTELLLLFILILYSLIVTLWGDGSAGSTPYLHLQFIIDCIFVPIFLYKTFGNKVDFENLSRYLISLGLLASLITLFLVYNFGFNIYLREHIIVDDLDSDTVQDSLRYMRGFTFSDSSTFGFGISQGLIFGLTLNETRKNKNYFFILILLLLSILFNARVGFVVALIAMLLLYKRLGISFAFYSLLSGVMILFFINISNFIEDNLVSIEWALSFFEETSEFFFRTNGSETTYDALTSDMIYFPSSLTGLFFGEGVIVFGKGSDVGYVNQIFNGGLFYLIILITTLIYFWQTFLKYYPKNFIGLFFIITLLVINFKGPALFTSHSFLRLFMLIYVVGKCLNLDKRLLLNNENPMMVLKGENF